MMGPGADPLRLSALVNKHKELLSGQSKWSAVTYIWIRPHVRRINGKRP